MVAEDDKFYSGVYKIKLTAEGYDVGLAKNGEEVIKLAKERMPDLLLLDLIMPVKDGFTTLSELKKDKKLKNIKVIIMSNLGQEEDINKAKTLGASEYLIKSNYSLQEMVDKIKGYLL